MKKENDSCYHPGKWGCTSIETGRLQSSFKSNLFANKRRWASNINEVVTVIHWGDTGVAEIAEMGWISVKWEMFLCIVVLTCDSPTGKTQAYSEGLANSWFELAVSGVAYGLGLGSWVASCQHACDWGERGQVKKPLWLLSGLFSSGWNHMLLSPDFTRALINGQRQMKDVVED